MLQLPDKSKLIYIISGLIILSLTFHLFQEKSIAVRQYVPGENKLPIIYLNDMFYADKAFNEAVRKAENTASEKDIRSIIVPHHLLASDIVADIMKRASGRNIELIAIIGPNHENIGTNKVATVKARWQTPLGYVESDQEMVDRFASEFNIKSDPEVFQNEHSMGAIMPFVNYYFTDARVLPIVFDSYAGYEEVERVEKWLSENLEENSLLITSIDFSHYLSKDEADQKDLETRNLIEKRDINTVLKLSNTENVDSPVSLAVSILYAQKHDLKSEILFNANSFDYLIIKPVETTSYFGITYSKK